VHLPRQLAVPASLERLRDVLASHEGPLRTILDIDGMRFELARVGLRTGSSLVAHLRNVFGDLVRVD
jgi:hypothetical protein